MSYETQTNNIVEQETRESQRPDLGIKRVEPAEAISVTSDQLHWLNETLDVPLVRITLDTGHCFLYGSAVKGNNTLQKIADDVPSERSRQAEIGLFKAMPNLLDNGSASNIDTVMFGKASVPLLKVAKRGSDVARLAFAMIPTDEGMAVVKVGIASHKNQSQMNGIITSAKPGKRRKHDG